MKTFKRCFPTVIVMIMMSVGFSLCFSQPTITLNRTLLNYGAHQGVVTTAQTVLVDNAGTGTLVWTATADRSWIDVLPFAGVGPNTLSISVDPAGMAPGHYTGSISIVDPGAANSPQTVNISLVVYAPGSTGVPFGSFATPANNSTVRGNIPVTGWALDDIALENIKIYRDPFSGEGGGLKYIGDAVFVEGARPDVELLYHGYPNNYKAGWGYMLMTRFLPNQGNGTYTLHAQATDMDGNTLTLGTKTIICDNANAVRPFGNLDVPTPGGTASGSNFVVWGWALTPQPNTIPFDGSTITIWVDGVNAGHPVYNIYRADIAGLFHGYNNSNGAAFLFYLDTTPYSNGVHIIYATVQDNAGNFDGIGARYFSILNRADRPSMSVLGNSILIEDGDTTPELQDGTDFGDLRVDGGTSTQTFTILNTGTETLFLNGTPVIDKSGSNANEFTVIPPAVTTVLPNGGETTFQVTFDPSDVGGRQATLSIDNNDPDRAPYTFAVRGTGMVDSDGDGMTAAIEGTGDRDGDGIINDEDFDPGGWIYNEADGHIVTGGSIQVTPSAGVNIIEDGTAGYYQFTVSQAGDYTLVYTPPAGYFTGTACPPQQGLLDPGPTDPNPLVVGLGSRDGTSDRLTDWTCAGNPWYTGFRLGPGDPVVINNNIPLRQPIPVRLTSLIATAAGDRITLTWTTAAEFNCAGFYIQRRLEKNTGYKTLNDTMIPAKGSAVSGATYGFADTPPKTGRYVYRLEETGIDGKSTFYGPVTAVFESVPSLYALYQNYPNPFNPQTRIVFDVAKKSHISIDVFDINGKRVRKLLAGQKAAGTYTVVWDRREDDGTPVAGGIYLCRMTAGENSHVIKMVYAK